MKPLIAKSTFAGLHLYIVTRYRIKEINGKKVMIAQTKYDITDLFKVIRGRIVLRDDVGIGDQLEMP
jgi:hypothetical protein